MCIATASCLYWTVFFKYTCNCTHASVYMHRYLTHTHTHRSFIALSSIATACYVHIWCMLRYNIMLHILLTKDEICWSLKVHKHISLYSYSTVYRSTSSYAHDYYSEKLFHCMASGINSVTLICLSISFFTCYMQLLTIVILVYCL